MLYDSINSWRTESDKGGSGSFCTKRQFPAPILRELFKKVKKSEERWTALVGMIHRKAPFTVWPMWFMVDSLSRKLRLGSWGNFCPVAKTRA